MIAQCTGNAPPQTISTRDEFAASFYYGNLTGADLVQYFDATVLAPLTITGMSTVTYDQGVGNPVVPNQVGATGNVNIWQVPTTWTGNSLGDPGLGGTPWVLLGTGTITVVAWPGESPIAIATPFVMPVGTYGIAIEMEPTTNGPNPGSLHTLGVNPNPLLTASDSFMTIDNQAIQQTGWTGGVNTATGLNLRISYTPDPASGFYEQFRDGCYFRPQAFYESFPSGLTTPDLANTGISCVPLGPNYIVTAVPSVIVPPTSTSLTLGAYGASSSANWDDALSTPFTLPFTFAYPGGSTNAVTISSNGKVYLDTETGATYDICGASYGSIAPFRDNKACVAPFFHDLDPSVGGGLYYDVDPANAFVRITWDQVQEWGVPAAVNTFQLTLWATGQIDISYGVLGNQSAGNNAIAGFTPGNGARLPAAQDLTATMPFQSGDGAIPPVLGMDVRPALGVSPNLVTTNITPGTLFVIVAAGFSPVAAPGLDLGFVGMPGCQLHINSVTTNLAPVVGGVATSALGTIPNNASWLGVSLFAQAAPLTSGLNLAGVLTSNGLCLKIGQF